MAVMTPEDAPVNKRYTTRNARLQGLSDIIRPVVDRNYFTGQPFASRIIRLSGTATVDNNLGAVNVLF